MAEKNRHTFAARFASEHACVTYLFRRRWPLGFRCPFCGTVQKDVAPAFTVVCRYCRKQTSITARTLMHGSKKNLAGWLQVAWLFCSREQGLSARELQRMLGLSCYRTAWGWLRKIRTAAAMAESAPCRGLVLFDVAGLSPAAGVRPPAPEIGLALELHSRKAETARVRFRVLESAAPASLVSAIGRLVWKQAGLQLGDGQWSGYEGLSDNYHLGVATADQRQKGRAVLLQAEAWLRQIFCGAVDSTHLQAYLDEFSFHCNTAFWPDRQAVFDSLATALLSPVEAVVPYAGKAG